MNIDLLKKIATLGRANYEVGKERPLVEMRHQSENTHKNPGIILVGENGKSYVNDSIVHELEQDLAALVSAVGIKVDGRPLHELVPYAAERIGALSEFFDNNQPEPDEEPKKAD